MCHSKFVNDKQNSRNSYYLVNHSISNSSPFADCSNSGEAQKYFRCHYNIVSVCKIWILLCISGPRMPPMLCGTTFTITPTSYYDPNGGSRIYVIGGYKEPAWMAELSSRYWKWISFIITNFCLDLKALKLAKHDLKPFLLFWSIVLLSIWFSIDVNRVFASVTKYRCEVYFPVWSTFV